MKEKAKIQLTEDMKRVLNEQRLGFCCWTPYRVLCKAEALLRGGAERILQA